MLYQILIIKINNRKNTALKVQKILSKFGCNIKVRLGLHSNKKDSCSVAGLIILELIGKKNIIQKLINNLEKLPEVATKYFCI